MNKFVLSALFFVSAMAGHFRDDQHGDKLVDMSYYKNGQTVPEAFKCTHEQRFRVYLDENPSTGYKWHLQENGMSLRRLVDPDISNDHDYEHIFTKELHIEKFPIKLVSVMYVKGTRHLEAFENSKEIEGTRIFYLQCTNHHKGGPLTFELIHDGDMENLQNGVAPEKEIFTRTINLQIIEDEL